MMNFEIQIQNSKWELWWFFCVVNIADCWPWEDARLRQSVCWGTGHGDGRLLYFVCSVLVPHDWRRASPSSGRWLSRVHGCGPVLTDSIKYRIIVQNSVIVLYYKQQK